MLFRSLCGNIVYINIECGSAVAVAQAIAGLDWINLAEHRKCNVGCTKYNDVRSVANVGFTGVIGSQDRYSERQLKIMSGGGLWVFQQDTPTGPVVIRHQLTSDMSTVEMREDNIRTALDFAAKMAVRQYGNQMRTALGLPPES